MLVLCSLHTMLVCGSPHPIPQFTFYFIPSSSLFPPSLPFQFFLLSVPFLCFLLHRLVLCCFIVFHVLFVLFCHRLVKLLVRPSLRSPGCVIELILYCLYIFFLLLVKFILHSSLLSFSFRSSVSFSRKSTFNKLCFFVDFLFPIHFFF